MLCFPINFLLLNGKNNTQIVNNFDSVLILFKIYSGLSSV